MRELQQPGMPVVQAIADRFGPDVAPDGVLDRAALAARAFGDPGAVADLNAIVHPAVRAEMAARVAAQQGTDHVVVLDIPLLAEGTPRVELQATIVVDVPIEAQVDRLVRLRGFDEADARSRIARQATREQRLAIATHLIDNVGDLADLARQVDAIWADLLTLAHVPAPGADHPPGPGPTHPPAPNERS